MKLIKRNLEHILLFIWFALLIYPSITIYLNKFSSNQNIQTNLVISILTIVVFRLIFIKFYFYLFTYPIIIFGIICFASDFFKSIDLLEILNQWHTFKPNEIYSVFLTDIKPYIFHIFTLLILSGVLCWKLILYQIEKSKTEKVYIYYNLLLAFIISSFAFVYTPTLILLKTWPINGISISSAVLFNTPILSRYSIGNNYTSPRLPNSWSATQKPLTDKNDNETYVMVIGESLRNDFLKECGGPQLIRSVHPDTIIGCDATSGSNATHTSVPLLISRELPGHEFRVSTDSTFQKAFQEVGFHTSWYSVQNQSVAWSDAIETKYLIKESQSDSDFFLPLLDLAISNSIKKQSIVMHTYGSHVPFCDRFNPEKAPYKNECDTLGDFPDDANTIKRKAMYANAVDNSVRVLNEIISKLQHKDGQVFLVFTPDHGVNFRDDNRKLSGHAFKNPTKWDSHVPIIFWANELWINRHKEEWNNLKNNINKPLMHIDVVPTLLAAANITYLDTRPLSANLLNPWRFKPPVQDRTRIVQNAIGSNVTWESILKDVQ